MPKTASTASESGLTSQTTITRAGGGTAKSGDSPMTAGGGTAKSGDSPVTAGGGTAGTKRIGRPPKYANDEERRAAAAAQQRARRAKLPKPEPKPKAPKRERTRRVLHGMDRPTPEAGATIGRWTLNHFTPGNSRKGIAKKWWCTCTCGLSKWVTDLNLRSGQSMGCHTCRRKPMDPNLTMTATQSLMSAMTMWGKSH